MAQPVIDMSLLGDKALDAALKELAIKVRDRIVKLGTKAGANVWLRAAKARAPVGPRKPAGRHLKSTLRVVSVPGSWARKYDSIGHRVVTGTRRELGIPDSDPYYYPAAVEYGQRGRGYGTKKGGGSAVAHFIRGTLRKGNLKAVPAQPFMRPAFDENIDRVKAVTAKKIWGGVQRAAAIAARKTAAAARKAG